MKQTSVTVLVTVKNSANTIEKCIDSLIELNYKNYSIYVTDAFSTDGTYEILKNLQKKYPKKIMLERIHGNIATAHNHMISKTNTEFVAMTDADCVVDRNWLKNLITGFDSKEILATAGFNSTPRTVNTLQNLIGKEFEDRFKRAPKFIPRAPTMNLCIRTKLAKQVKFDERIDFAQETDWGYRITKIGKMKYVPEAVVYHYHRPTWKSYFKQMLRYGTQTPLLYIKHPSRATGDYNSKPIYFAEEFVFLIALSFLFLSIFTSFLHVLPFGASLFFSQLFPQFFTFFCLFVACLFILYFIESASLTKNPKEIFLFFLLFFVRNVAWTIGLVLGIFNLIFTSIKKLF
jgi:glycosyltransferase involved in cell wall biosynthesis